MTSVVWLLYGIIGYMKEIVVLVCKRCGHRWVPMVAKPGNCPGCHTRYWDKDYSRSDIVLKMAEEESKVGSG